MISNTDMETAHTFRGVSEKLELVKIGLIQKDACTNNKEMSDSDCTVQK